jgi:basic membrane lipoprotein Med (substrate-binding protein (PBP1-ABC) superfamily)
MKSRIGLALVMVLAIILSACGGAASTPEAVTSGPFRVAVIMPSAINDLAFSQSMFDALTLIQTEMGGKEKFDFVYTDNAFVVDDAASAIRDYATQGYNLIVAHGSQYGASLQEIAPDFPNTSFAWGTAGDTFGLANVFAYEAYSQEGGYVNGVIAAAISQAGVVGVVGPIEVGDAKLYVDGFKAGAEATKPGIQVNINYIGSFSDVALASEAAQTHADAGADAMTGSAQMVVGAVGVAKERGIPWFGTQSNQTSLAPEVVVASQVYHWEVVLRDIITKINAGTLGGEAYAVSLENGGEVVEFNDGYSLPADVKTLAEETIAGIKDGSIKTGVGGR